MPIEPLQLIPLDIGKENVGVVRHEARGVDFDGVVHLHVTEQIVVVLGEGMLGAKEELPLGGPVGH